MNPIAVNVMPTGNPFPGVAEAAAAGSAAPGSLADLFCQMLAAAQAGVTETLAGVEQPGDCTEETSDTDAAVAESTDAAAVLAAALTAMPATTAVVADTATDEAALVAPVKGALATANPAGLPVADAVVIAPPAEQLGADEEALVQAATASAAEAPGDTLAMQLAAARTGLGAEGAMTPRRFGDATKMVSRERPTAEPVLDDGHAPPSRGLAHSAVNAVHDAAEQPATGNESDESSGELVKPLVNGKSGESPVTTAFDLKSALFGATDVHTASRARSEPVAQAAQANVPQSVSVRDVGDAVVRSVHYLSGRTEDVVTVRLVPQSLGELRIAVHSGERGMEVVLTAANNAARDALETNLAGLREALGREGMNIERVSVQVFAPFDAGHQPASGQHNAQGGANSSARQPGTAYRESSGSPPHEQGGNEQQPRRQQHSGRLNMWV